MHHHGILNVDSKRKINSEITSNSPVLCGFRRLEIQHESYELLGCHYFELSELHNDSSNVSFDFHRENNSMSI